MVPEVYEKNYREFMQSIISKLSPDPISKRRTIKVTKESQLYFDSIKNQRFYLKKEDNDKFFRNTDRRIDYHYNVD